VAKKNSAEEMVSLASIKQIVM